MSTYAIYYASKVHMKISVVRFFSEAQAREWYGKIGTWRDVVRVRLVDETTGDVCADQVLEAKIADPDDIRREELVRELAERMDRVFTADIEVKRGPSTEPTKPRVVQPGQSELCMCGHTKIEHGGSDSSGRCDAWDVERDARKYDGPYPVVAHPPCFLWVNLAAVNWKRYQLQLPAWYPDGSDDGCFESALASVRRFGGVLEHPAGSHAWSKFGLNRPSGLCWDRDVLDGSWVCEVWQSAYGHAARKRTWLFCSGERAPADLRWSAKPGTHQVGWFDRNKPTLSKAEAIKSPPAFAELLISLARSSRAPESP